MHAFRSAIARVPRVAKVAAGTAGAAGFAFATSAASPAQSATIAGLLDQISTRLDRIETTLGIGKDYSAELQKIADVKKTQPDNIGIQSFDFDYFNSLSPELQDRMIACARSGFENPDSGMGAYAIQPDDYDVLTPYLDACIRTYHKVPASAKHTNNWSLEGVAGLPADGKLDLTKLGLGETSMRVRTGRNLKAFPLPGGMSQQDRCDMENVMLTAFKDLIKDPAYGGRYVSLTPGHECNISDDEYKELVKAHIMFKDMADDPYLASAGIASDWPYGRGCYISEDKKFIVWVGEEDHLRIMCMFKGTMLNDVFDRLSNAIKMMDTKAEFAYSPTYGVVTSCPTNLGTGMRASVHIKIPNLTKDGTDTKAKAILKPKGLSVRGVGGEHTPIGADGTVDISPSARFCITEAEIVTALYLGIVEVMEAEAAAK